MAIKFACGSCGKRFEAKEEHAGKRSKCPKCGGDIEVPNQAVAVANGSPPPPLPERDEGLVIPGLQASPDDEYEAADVSPRASRATPTPVILVASSLILMSLAWWNWSGIGGGALAILPPEVWLTIVAVAVLAMVIWLFRSFLSPKRLKRLLAADPVDQSKVPPLDEVQFTVYRPRTIQPDRWYPLLAFAHLAESPLGSHLEADHLIEPRPDGGQPDSRCAGE